MKTNFNNPLMQFDALQNSASFLNFIVQNSSSCVLILDENLVVQAYNESAKKLFNSIFGEYILYKKIGDALGCGNSINEQKQCTHTSKCKLCTLKNDLYESFSSKQAVYKKIIENQYLNSDNMLTTRVLQYSIKPIKINTTEYITILIEDITHTKPVNEKPLEQTTIAQSDYWIS